MDKFCTQVARGCHYGMLLVVLSPAVVRAHVALDAPLGGESLAGGFSFSIAWHVAEPHNTENWDLWYSTASPNGPWTPIALNLPMGDIGANAAHSYNWQVPNSDLATGWVRVQQDNVGTDYDSVSNAHFTVSAAAMGDFTGNNVVNSADLAIWQDNFGTNAGAFFSQGDDDSDGDVDGNDFLRWQRNSDFGSSLAAISAIPEPSALLLLITWIVLAVVRRH